MSNIPTSRSTMRATRSESAWLAVPQRTAISTAAAASTASPRVHPAQPSGIAIVVTAGGRRAIAHPPCFAQHPRAEAHGVPRHRTDARCLNPAFRGLRTLGPSPSWHVVAQATPSQSGISSVGGRVRSLHKRAPCPVVCSLAGRLRRSPSLSWHSTAEARSPRQAILPEARWGPGSEAPLAKVPAALAKVRAAASRA